jgi:alpha-tubulin suppressor-like RCC1 family protein
MIGDDETPDTVEPVNIGADVRDLAMGWYHTCAITSSRDVRCFGVGRDGLLGYGNTQTIGDDEFPASAGNVPVGGLVSAIGTGTNHTCAVLFESGELFCWGNSERWQLGYATQTTPIGDDETPASVGAVDIGDSVLQVAGGLGHTCVLLGDRGVKCWGSGTLGRLGYGNGDTIGDDESPAAAGYVDVGGRVRQIVAGSIHTCALLENGRVRCWGAGTFGALGYGNTDTIGDDESPASAGFVDVGGSVVALAAGNHTTCAVLVGGRVRCWGTGEYGVHGYGHTATIGDDETPASVGDVNTGDGNVGEIAVGFLHVCVTIIDGGVRCWGRASTGALGYGNLEDIGDDETPASAGDVRVVPR